MKSAISVTKTATASCFYTIETHFATVRILFIGESTFIAGDIERLYPNASRCCFPSEATGSFDLIVSCHEREDPYYTVFSDKPSISGILSKEKTMWLIYEVVSEAVSASASSGWCLVHAALVFCDNDSVIALVGVSRSGKSTLASIFATRGFRVSDEYAWFNYRSGKVAGDCLPLRVRRDSFQRLPDDLKMRSQMIVDTKDNASFLLPVSGDDSGVYSLRSIVFPRYQTNSLDNLRFVKSERLPAMLLDSFDSRDSPSHRLLRLLDIFSEHDISMFELVYSNARVAVDLLLSMHLINR